MTSRRAHPEDDLQAAVVKYLAAAKPKCIWYAVPNGGVRNVREAARFKAMGVRAGVSDLVFQWAGGSGCIELKAPGGRQSGRQKAFDFDCRLIGVPYVIASSIEEVHSALVSWGLVDPERVQVQPKRRSA